MEDRNEKSEFLVKQNLKFSLVCIEKLECDVASPEFSSFSTFDHLSLCRSGDYFLPEMQFLGFSRC